MKTTEKTEKYIHHGHAIKRFRHILGIKQEVLGVDLGMSQAMISMYESKKIIEDEMIDKFAKALGVSSQLIKDLEEDPVTVIIENNTFEEGNNIGCVVNNIIDINSIEYLFDLNKEIQRLYERLIQIEKEKNILLEKLLKQNIREGNLKTE